MSEARLCADWSQTSSLMALLANCHRDPTKTPAFTPANFDPMVEEPEPIPADIGVLKSIFMRGKSPQNH